MYGLVNNSGGVARKSEMNEISFGTLNFHEIETT